MMRLKRHLNPAGIPADNPAMAARGFGRFNIIRLLCGCGWVAVVAGLGRILGAEPSRAVIEGHLDASVEVYGHYAAVRLPLHQGVRLWNPTAIRVSPKGEIFVANYVGEIYRILDRDGDGLEDTAVLFCNVTKDGLRYPTSMAFRGNTLFVGTAQEIRAYQDADGDGVAERSWTLLKLPCGDDTQNWTFGLCVGPDDNFYVALSTDSYQPKPAVDAEGWRGSLLRVSPDGRQVERLATGLRFAPGLAFDPEGNLFFTDNEGGGNPTEELNLFMPGKFYGHNPGKFSVPNQDSGVAPLARLTSGRGTCGMTFNARDNDFGGAAGEIFVAFWGVGQVARDGSIGRLKIWRDSDGTFRVRELPFCAWLSKAYDLTFGPSRDLYVTQFGPTVMEMTPSPQATGAVYRLIPAPWFTPTYQQPPTFPRIRGDVARGKQLFVSRGCAQCHSLDGTTELLGPNLARLGERLDYPAALQAVLDPSQSIRTGYESQIVETEDGEMVQGRIVTSDAKQVTLMVAGNQTVTIPRPTIQRQRSSKRSLMPEGLLAGLSEKQRFDLFAYLEIQERPQRLRQRYRLGALVVIGCAVGMATWALRKSLRLR